MKAIKKVRKTFTKAAKSVGLNAYERRHIRKVAGNIAYDTAVNVCSTLCLDAAYAAIDTATCGVCMATTAVKAGINKLVKKEEIPATTATVEATVVTSEEENVG